VNKEVRLEKATRRDAEARLLPCCGINFQGDFAHLAPQLHLSFKKPGYGSSEGV